MILEKSRRQREFSQQRTQRRSQAQLSSRNISPVFGTHKSPTLTPDRKIQLRDKSTASKSPIHARHSKISSQQNAIQKSPRSVRIKQPQFCNRCTNQYLIKYRKQQERRKSLIEKSYDQKCSFINSFYKNQEQMKNKKKIQQQNMIKQENKRKIDEQQRNRLKRKLQRSYQIEQQRRQTQKLNQMEKQTTRAKQLKYQKLRNELREQIEQQKQRRMRQKQEVKRWGQIEDILQIQRKQKQLLNKKDKAYKQDLLKQIKQGKQKQKRQLMFERSPGMNNNSLITQSDLKHTQQQIKRRHQSYTKQLQKQIQQNKQKRLKQQKDRLTQNHIERMMQKQHQQTNIKNKIIKEAKVQQYLNVIKHQINDKAERKIRQKQQQKALYNQDQGFKQQQLPKECCSGCHQKHPQKFLSAIRHV